MLVIPKPRTTQEMGRPTPTKKSTSTVILKPSLRSEFVARPSPPTPPTATPSKKKAATGGKKKKVAVEVAVALPSFPLSREERHKIMKQTEDGETERRRPHIEMMTGGHAYLQEVNDFHNANPDVRIELEQRRIKLLRNPEFHGGSDTLVTGAQKLLRQAANGIKLIAKLAAQLNLERFEYNIDGHVNQPDPQFMLDDFPLSESRAVKVTNELMACGVPSEILHPRWYSATKPLRKEDFGGNRRVEIMVYEGTEGKRIWSE